METKQLNGYKIEFYNKEPFYHIHSPSRSMWWETEIEQSNDGEIDWFTCKEAMQREEYIKFAGKVSDISEELAKLLIETGSYYSTFKNYKTNDNHKSNQCKSAKQSFQTLSDLEYCVISKTT